MKQPFSIEDVISYAKEKKDLFVDASPEKLYSVIETSLLQYRDKNLLADDSSLDDIEIEEDEYSTEMNNQEFVNDNDEIFTSLVADGNKKQIANVLIAYNLLQESEELGASTYCNKAYKKIKETLNISEQDLLKFSEAISNDTLNEMEFDKMENGTKEMCEDFQRSQWKYKNISNYGEAFLKTNSGKNQLSLEEGFDKYDSFEQKNRINDKNRNDYLGLYSLVRKNNEGRSGWSRFFHPFQNRKEKKIIAELENRLSKLGISKEGLDTMYNKLNEKYNVSVDGFEKKIVSSEQKEKINEDRERIPGLADDTDFQERLKASKERAKEREAQKQMEQKQSQKQVEQKPMIKD